MIMPTIKAPYNFVPLSEKVFIPSWAEQISQDIPFSDGEDGTIEVIIKNLSPLFVRNGHVKDEPTEWSSHIIVDKQKKYFIPATTLKGCFRSVLEILSFSKMSRYNDDFFGYRSFTTQIKGADYAGKMKKIKSCGWLYMADGEFYIDECAKGITKISHIELKGFFPDFYEGKDHETAEAKQMSIGTKEEPYPVIDTTSRPVEYVSGGKYHVVCTGYMNGKKVEYLFSTQITSKLKVSNEVFKKFDTIHNYTPYYSGEKGKPGFLRQRLMAGEKIPVFYEKAGGVVSNMGITRMFRYPYAFSVKDNIRKVQTEDYEERTDLPEAIFGYTNKDNSLRGRVQFGHAFCNSIIQDGECNLQKGVFGQPRASYFPLYLSQNEGSVDNYNYNIPIAGRKRYRIVKGHQTIGLSRGNDNERTMTSFRPLPANKTFKCTIRVHNLRKAEIGALISAITFHGNSAQGAYHNLGLAKAYGYGCISCNITELKDLKYSETEYLAAFEEEIASYMKDTYNDGDFSMQTDEAIAMLVKIASATHSREDMEHMMLGEFEQFKESRNASSLKEDDVALLSINEIEGKLKAKKATLLYEEIKKQESTIDTKDPSAVKRQIENLVFIRQQYSVNNMDTQDIDERLSKLNTLLSVLENPTQLTVNTVVSALCIDNKKVRIEGYDYDIQLTVSKGFDSMSLINKQLEVKIKQISKLGKIVQVEFLKEL